MSRSLTILTEEYKRWANGSDEEQNGTRMWENGRRPTGKESDNEQAGRNKM